MKFYCMFNLIDHFRLEKGHSCEEMYRFFRERGVRKSELMFCKEYCALDSIPRIVEVVQEYSGKGYLEICLALGYLPEKYKDIYY